MNENDEQISAQDVLRSSELNARLLRRLTDSQGVIDVQLLREIHARLTRWMAQSGSLLDDLITRYSLDDGSRAGTQPLIMEQAWMVNINSYLANNSFSSTTQAFSSAPPSSPPSSNASSNAAVERFRVNRSPKRRARETAAPPEAQAAAQNLVLKTAETLTPVSTAAAHISDEKDRPTTGGEVKAGKEKADEDEPLATAKAVAPVGATSTPLTLPALTPVAPAQPQQKTPGAGANFSQPVARAYEIKVEKAHQAKDEPQHAQAKPPLVTARASLKHGEVNPFEEVFEMSGSSSPVPAKAVVPATTLATLSAEQRQNASSLLLVQKQLASPLLQPRAPEFIWRQKAEAQTLREQSESSSGGHTSTAARRSGEAQPTAQAPQSQTFTPEAVRRTDARPADSGVTTERIIRSISRQLLIERERRGY